MKDSKFNRGELNELYDSNFSYCEKSYSAKKVAWDYQQEKIDKQQSIIDEQNKRIDKALEAITVIYEYDHADKLDEVYKILKGGKDD